MNHQETRCASQLIHELAIAREQVIALTDQNRRLRAILRRYRVRQGYKVLSLIQKEV